IVPGGGRIVWNAADALLRDTLQMGCWTPLEGFAREPRTDALWSARAVHGVQDFSRFELLEGGQPRGTVQWSLIGAHNVEHGLAAADQVWLYTAADLGWDTGGVLAALGERAHGSGDIDTLARDLARAARPGDHLLIMSNGGFGGLHGKLLAELERAAGTALPGRRR